MSTPVNPVVSRKLFIVDLKLFFWVVDVTRALISATVFPATVTYCLLEWAFTSAALAILYPLTPSAVVSWVRLPSPASKW